MNAHILGDWLVWESPDGTGYTLDTSMIQYTMFRVEGGESLMRLFCGERMGVRILTDEDATWFHTWWMQRLEDEEKVEAEWREEERKRREKQAKTTGDEEPA